MNMTTNNAEALRALDCNHAHLELVAGAYVCTQCKEYALAAQPPAVSVDEAMEAAAKEMRRLAQECHDCGQDVHANTYYHCAGMVERIIEDSRGCEHIESAPAAMGRGNVIDHPRKPPHDDSPLSAAAQAAAREADAALNPETPDGRE